MLEHLFNIQAHMRAGRQEINYTRNALVTGDYREIQVKRKQFEKMSSLVKSLS